MAKIHPIYEHKLDGKIYHCGKASYKWFNEADCPVCKDATIVDLKFLETDGGLQSWAAQAASKILLDNWRNALGDGYELADLLPDVEMVINNLRYWVSDIVKAVDGQLA